MVSTKLFAYGCPDRGREFDKRKDKELCYIASAETKRDWLIHGHVALQMQCIPRATSEQLLPAPTGSVHK